MVDAVHPILTVTDIPKVSFSLPRDKGPFAERPRLPGLTLDPSQLSYLPTSSVSATALFRVSLLYSHGRRIQFGRNRRLH